MKKISILLFIVLALSSCKKPFVNTDKNSSIEDDPTPLATTQVIAYAGIGPDDIGGHNAIENPERGFRTEFAMYISNLRNPWHNTDYSSNFAGILQQTANNFQYGTDELKLAQVMFYISPSLLGQTIPVAQINNIKSILDGIKAAGYKAVVRFAYQTEGSVDDHCGGIRNVSRDNGAPQVQVWHIQNHLQQLSPLFNEYYPLIHAFQAGFVGVWGEWHTDYYGHACWGDAINAILTSYLQAVPGQRHIMLREPWHKRDGNLANNIRLGYHNDFFTLDQFNPLWDYSWASPLQNYQEWLDFNQVLNEGSRTCVDGEMPYDGPGDFNLNFPIAESYNFARRLRAHGYTSFSIVHNYNTNINAWKNKSIHASDLQNDNVPVTDGYFVNSSGQLVSRSLYEYIRDHLGYRLQLTDGYFPATVNIGHTYNFTVNLKNFGFAAPVNPHEVYFTLIDASGTMKKILTAADSRSWTPYNLANNNSYTISADMFIDGSFIPGTYNIGIWIPDPVNQLKYNPEYAIKFANKNIQWWTDPNNEHLVNIIGQVIVE